MTIAEQLRQEGWQSGLGEGLRQAAFRLKSLGSSIEIIQKATGLSKEEIENLEMPKG